jgi:hypothetical protein
MKSLAVKALALIAMIAMTSPAFWVGDILAVTIFAGGVTQEALNVEVSSGGTISFPFLGEIKAEGLSVTQLTEMLTRPLAEDYFVNPQVFISVGDQKSREANITHHKIYVQPWCLRFQGGPHRPGRLYPGGRFCPIRRAKPEHYHSQRSRETGDNKDQP